MSKLRLSWGAGILAALAIGARLFRLDHQSLWIDEGYSIGFSEGGDLPFIVEQLLETDLSDRFRIPFYLVLNMWRGLFGDSAFALRSLPALFGVGSVLVIYLTARRLFDRRAAIAVGAAVAVGSYFVQYSQELRDYSAGTLISGLLLFIFLGSRSGDHSRWHPWAFGLAAAIGLSVNILMAGTLASIAIVHIIDARDWRVWLRWWSPAAVLSLAPIMLYLSSSAATDPSQVIVSRSDVPVPIASAYSVFGLLFGTTFGPPQEQLRIDRGAAVSDNLVEFGVVGICMLLLTLAAIAVWRGRWWADGGSRTTNLGTARILILLFLTQLVVSAGLHWYIGLFWQPRHSFFVAPSLVLMLGAWYDRADEWLPRSRQIALAGGTLLVAINLWSLANYYTNDAHERDDFRSATEYVLSIREAGTPSILMGAVGNNRLFEYYGDDQMVDAATLDIPPKSVVGLSDSVWGATDASTDVILVVSREYTLGNVGVIVASMADRYEVIDSAAFSGVNVYTFGLIDR